MVDRVLVISEAGVNHNGNRDAAFELVEAAAGAGADAVKFQVFHTENLITDIAEKAEYQKETTDKEETQFSMLKRLELSHDIFRELAVYCEKIGIRFIATAFDSDSLAFLSLDLGLPVLKIPSGEITNGPLLLEHARTGRDLIVSTGMSTLEEVRDALAILAFGLTKQSGGPTYESARMAFESTVGKDRLKAKVTLLHCTSEYPAPIEDINLRAMETMRKEFNIDVGYSDHSDGLVVPIAAVSLGATVIEKHFTLDKLGEGPDHRASIEPSELKILVQNIRITETIIGNGEKVVQGSEKGNRELVRKSVVAKTTIKKGEKFSLDNITVKRPGSGRNPMEFWNILGEKASRNFQRDDIV